MERYQALLNQINSTYGWPSDERFFIDVITKSTIKLIELCNEDLNGSRLIRIFPLLRQIQENCVVLLGLGTNTLSSKEVTGGKTDPKKIFKRIMNSTNENQDKVKSLSIYMKGIKDILNQYAHTNLDGLMLLFMEEHQTYETMKFNKLVVQFVIGLVENLFIPMINHLYKVKLELPSLNQIVHELKDLGGIKYTANKLPDGYKDYLNQSEVLKGYFSSVIANFKQQIVSLKTIIKGGEI